MTREPLCRAAAALLVLAGLSARALAGQTAGVVAVNPAWLKVDSAAKSVEFTATAGLNTTNGGININGSLFGALRLSVPVGWSVVIHFRNADATFPHSLEVMGEVTTMPSAPVPAAFAHAATGQLVQGMPTGAHQDLRFVADKTGEYLIYCPVPTHGMLGMWMRFDVSAKLTRPTLTASKPGAP